MKLYVAVVYIPLILGASLDSSSHNDIDAVLTDRMLKTQCIPSGGSGSGAGAGAGSGVGMNITVITTWDGSEMGFMEEWLLAHNVVREAHQVGPVTWDKDLAKGALNTVTKCARTGNFKRDPNLRIMGLGQNLWQAAYQGFKPVVPPGGICYDWYSENFRGFYNFSIDYQPGTDQFTQMVWKGTNRIGCALVRTPRNVIGGCQYASAGNIQYEFESNVFPSTLPRNITRRNMMKHCVNFDSICEFADAYCNDPSYGGIMRNMCPIQCQVC